MTVRTFDFWWLLCFSLSLSGFLAIFFKLFFKILSGLDKNTATAFSTYCHFGSAFAINIKNLIFVIFSSTALRTHIQYNTHSYLLHKGNKYICLILETVKNLNGIVAEIGKVDKTSSALGQTILNLSDAEAKLTLRSAGLTDGLIDSVLAYKKAQNESKGLIATHKTQIGVLDVLKAKFQNLWAAIAKHPVLFAVGAGVTIAALALNHYIDSAEETSEKVKNLLNDFNEMKSTAEKNEKTIKELSSEYEELAEGVNSLGQNVKLSEEEFSRYHEIVNQIADMSPELVSGWDAEGNAIINLKNNVDALTKSYENAKKRAYENLLFSNEEGNANDIVKDYRNIINGTWTNAGSKVTLDMYQEFSDALLSGDGSKIAQTIVASSDTDHNNLVLNALGIDIDDIVDKNNKLVMSEQEIYQVQKKLQTLILEENSKVQQGVENLQTVADAYLNLFLLDDEDYSKIDDSTKNALSIIVNSLSKENFDELGILGESVDANSIGTYVAQLLDTVKSDSNIQTAITELFKPDYSEMPVDDARAEINKYLFKLSKAFDMSHDEFLEAFGLDTVYNSYTKLSNSFNDIVGGDGAQLAKLRSYTEDFTSSQVELWLEVTKGVNSAEEAINEYNAEVQKATEETPSFEITEKQAAALSEYQSRIESLSSTYGNIFNLTSNDLTSLMTDFREYAYIFEEFGVTGEEGVGDVQGALHALAEKLKEVALEKCPQMADAIESIFGTIANYDFDFSKNLDSFNELDDLLTKVRNGTVFHQNELSELLVKYPELASAIQKVAEGYKLEEEAVTSLTNTSIEALNISIASQMEQLKLEIEGIVRKGVRDITPGLVTSDTTILDIFSVAAAVDGEELERLNEQYKALEELQQKLLDLQSSANKKGSESEPELYDWYGTAISRLQRQIDNLGESVSNTFDPWFERNEALKEQIETTTELLQIQRNAYNAYWDKAQEVEIDSKYIKLIQQGYRLKDYTIGIESIDPKNEELINQIEEYTKWYEKYLEMIDAASATQRMLNSQEMQRFTNISEEFSGRLSVIENRAAAINNLISLTEEKGYIVSKVLYDELLESENSNYDSLLSKRNALIAQFNKSDIIKESDAWYEMVDAINQVTLELQESELATVQYQNAIRELDWSNFDRILESIHDIVEETEFLLNLFSNDKLIDEFGNFTSAGLTTLGQHGINYQTYLAKSREYANELKEIRDELENDQYNTKLLEREEELLGLQRESILNAESEKQAMIEIAQEAIQAQIDYTQELIDKKKEALDAEVALYEYQRSVSEKTDNIANLRKQMSVYSLDDSEEGQQKLQTVKMELEKAEKDLDEFKYDKWHQDQTAMLDELMSEYTELQEKRSADTETLFKEASNNVSENASIIADTLNQRTQELGYQMNDHVVALNNSLGNLDLTLAAIKDENIRMVNAMDSLQSSIVGDNGTGLTGINTILTELLSYYEDGLTVTVKNNKVPGSGGGSSSGGTGGSSSGYNPSISDDDDDIGSAIGTIITNATGKWYSNSYGGKSGNVTSKNADAWMITKINENSPYPYHIVGLVNGRQVGGSGWVKGSQIGYKHGSEYIDEDQLAWTQEGYGQNEIIYRRSDGAMLTRLGQGDMVFTAEMTQKLWDLANGNYGSILPPKQIKLPNVSRQATGNIQLVIENMNLPNVQNAQQFASQLVDALKNNTTAQKAIRAVSIDLAAGKPTLGVNRLS